jgi:hypothetical protein
MTINRNLANLASAVVSTGGDLATANLSGTITNSQLAGSITSDKISSITSSHVTTALGFTPGSVTSVATGNGLSGGTITTSGTLSVACPSFNTVGSYAFIGMIANGGAGSVNFSAGSNYSAGGSQGQIVSIATGGDIATNNLSGTWKWMGANGSFNAGGGCCPQRRVSSVGCRVS